MCMILYRRFRMRLLRRHVNRVPSRSALAMIVLLAMTFVAAAAETNGFLVKFTSADDKATDFTVLPNLWLFVEKGTAATPFLPPGKFVAEFNGSISAELRGTYFFKAEQLAGTVKLEINGKTVLLATGSGGESPLTEGVQLNKGPNAIKATFTSTDTDSSLRIGWTERGPHVNPVPAAVIAHARGPGLENAEELHLGRELFLEYRCARCHDAKVATPVPELAMDAPRFDGIGARRNAAWLAEWVRDPQASGKSVFMPRLLHGTTAKQDAEAIAAALAAMRTEAAAPLKQTISRKSNKALAEIDKRSGPGAKPTLSDVNDAPEQGAENRNVFERFHCTGCHDAPNAPKSDPGKISLKYVAQKFPTGKLIEFLKAPEEHFAWIRMPNFKLADSEAKELADFLVKDAKPLPTATPADEAMIERGNKLIRSSGCLNCHNAGKMDTQLSAPALPAVAAATRGCLAEQRNADAKAPDFGLTALQRSALIAFLKTDRSSLSRHSPMEFAARQTQALQCNACHGQIDLVPPMDFLGGKLKPEWVAEFLAGEPFKIRADIHPKGGAWVTARMPAFASRARLLAQGMAAQQGYPPKTIEEGAADAEAAKIGHKMIGKDNGLSCISCHSINDMPALEVFESEGTNLGLAARRLLKPYFFRWMRNPLSVDPQSKMPAFFSEDGKSALTEYYDGDAEKQINALYQYIRLGEQMPPPSAGAQ
jgi:cytochrome c553/cytochrome c1